MTVNTRAFTKTVSAGICAASLGLAALPASANYCPHHKGYHFHHAPGGMYQYHKPGYGMNPYLKGPRSMPGYQGGEKKRGKKDYVMQQDARPTSDTKDLVDTAAAAGNFNTLIKALDAAGLKGLLKGEGPFTVFAPTDEAFAKLPEGKLDELLSNKEKLAAVLKYHVVPRKVSAADILQARELKTADGQTLSVQQIDVAKADIKTKNGIIHVVDSVLVPAL